MAHKDLLITQKAFDFTKWLLQHTAKFPKSSRFSVAVKLENAILDFIELTAVANTKKNKIPLLNEADAALVKARLLFRLSHEMQFVNFKSYEYGSKQMVELGRMLGGWLKNPGKS